MNPFAHNLYLRGCTVDWSQIAQTSYLRSIPSLSQLLQLDFHSRVTFFAGENGSGKSTLLEALAVACGFNPEGGTKNYNFSTYDSHSEFYQALRLVRGVRRPRYGYFLRAESFYNVATKEEEYADISQELHQQSHGESFLTIVSQFHPNGLYFLDEPEAALSPQRQLTLLMEIDRCAKGGAQFVIATHSPILLGLPDAEILSFDETGIHPCRYEDTDSYQITKMFLNHREQMLQNLLDISTPE